MQIPLGKTANLWYPWNQILSNNREIVGPSEVAYPTRLELLPAATKLGQGNIFRSVCQEFCPQGVGGWVWVWSQGGGSEISGGVWNFRGGVKFWGGVWNFFFFFFQFLFPQKNPSGMHTPPRDGQCAAGTHPTGMHSCWELCVSKGSPSHILETPGNTPT